MKSFSALAAASGSDARQTAHVHGIDSLCPYCGVGCALTYMVDDDNDILYTRGRDGSANAGRLCVKGRYGFDYSMHPQRLTKPLIRRDSAYPRGPLSGFSRPGGSGPRKPGGVVDYDEVMPHFREASWDEALDLISRRLSEIKDTHGSDALGGFGSAKGSNEEAYLFQKMVRAVFGTNNVDHCTRLCHASSVYALMEGIGSGAVTNVVRDVENAEAALIVGCNPTANHPVAATFMKDAATRGTRLLVANVRRPGIADHAHQYLQIKPGSDVALYNAMMHVMIRDGLYDRDFVRDRTEGFEALRDMVREYTPERAAKFTGIPADDIERFARTFGEARSVMIFWGMGISQHVFGTNNSRCLIALAMLSGNVGRPGTGLHPLRGQNNVQGASDAGLIPMYYPDYQSVEDPKVHAWFEGFWDAKLSRKTGRTVTELTQGALDGEIKGMYCMGENPFLSDPDINKVRKALSNLEFLAVQDLFLTETAEFADVVLPASSFMEKLGTYTNTDRRVQIGRPVREMPGEARQDWQIIAEVSRRMGYPMDYESPAQIFDEMVRAGKNYANLSYDVLGDFGKWYPCPDPAGEGTRILFGDSFPLGRGRFVPAELTASRDLPDADFPMVMNTGRVLEHWHTGTMTRRSRALDAIAPDAFVEVNPEDAERLGIVDGGYTRVSSRRGSILIKALVTDRVSPGSVFVPMHFREAAANELTDPAVDPYGKIPEFKFSAVRLEAIADIEAEVAKGREAVV